MNRFARSAPPIAAFLLVALLGSLLAAPVVAQGFTMGFVDMEKIIEKHPATQRATEQIKGEMQSRLEALKQEQTRMRALRDDLDLLKEGSPEHLEQLKKIKILQATLELNSKIIRIELDLRLVDELKTIYNRCREVVSLVAQERGLKVVAMYSSSPVDGQTRQELIGDIVTRPFIHIDPGLDITEAVLAKLQ